MTLEEIRSASSLNELKKAIVYLSDNMDSMGYGIFIAYGRTVAIKAGEFGVSVGELNNMASDYQLFGSLEPRGENRIPSVMS